MKLLHEHTGRGMVLRRSDVDTDQIIPAEYCKRLTKSGYQDALFAEWRKDPTFVLNHPERSSASILVAGRNFGTGSSREHAVWALRDWGFAVVIATSFGDIFRRNALNNGVLAIELPESVVAELADRVDADPSLEITADLVNLEVRSGELRHSFTMDQRTRWLLLNGLDEIAVTLEKTDAISAYEQVRRPWLPSIRPTPPDAREQPHRRGAVLSTVTVIPGDGIGPAVIDQALHVLDALGLDLDIVMLDQVNATTYLRTGTALSDADFDRIRSSAGTLLGAVGDARVDADYARSVLLRLRFELDLYVNYRPATLLHDRLSPLRAHAHRAIDCVIIRENTEGLYAGIGGTLRPFTPHETAIDAEISTYHGVSRIIDFAFSIARRAVCMVDKSNAVRYGGQLWQRCWREATARHPQFETSHLYVDTAAMKLITDPTAFDVIVANNSHGDILSDLAAALAGGLGTATSANINGATGFGLFEPVHGTAPDIADQDIANPIGAILTGALLIERLGHTEAAAAVRRAVTASVLAGRVTPDLGGRLDTKDTGAAIRAQL